MERLLDRGLTGDEKQDMRRLISERYNWNKIAEQTIEVYKKALNSLNG
jgi:glycosyltransferase involved in cell wall biosynthesis